MSVATLARYGRSFRLAGRLLPRATLLDAADLYAFCRTVDDLADEATDASAARAALADIRRAIELEDRGHGAAARMLALRDRTGVGLTAATTLIDTVVDDIGSVRVAHEAALLQYAFGVAGTVGQMMCVVLGADDARAEPYAVDLGMAMQLTNIARDVVEDAARDRLYLPATWLPADLDPSDISNAAGPAFTAVTRVLETADGLYRRAELGYRYLPARVRPAIRVAGRLYEEIGHRIMRRGPAHLASARCVVPVSRKLVLVATCLGAPSGGARRGAANSLQDRTA